MIHKLQICIYLFRSLIEIVDQNELFIQMNCRILCGQSNQIQITISLFHIFIFIFIFNLSISKIRNFSQYKCDLLSIRTKYTSIRGYDLSDKSGTLQRNKEQITKNKLEQ